MVEDSLVVHNFVLSSKIGKTASLPSEELIARGSNLVAAVQTRERWRSVVPSQASASSSVANAGRMLTLKSPPPAGKPFWDRFGRQPTRAIRQWGDLDVEAKTAVDVSQLQEFRGTDFSYLLKRKSKTGKTTLRQPRGRKRPREATDEEQGDNVKEGKKRRRIEGTTLHSLIPQPHHHRHLTVAMEQTAVQDITKFFSPHNKSPFVPAPPYLTEEVDAYFKDPYARSAWLIPVSGRLPWKEVSQAQIVSSISTSPLATGNTCERPIIWSAILLKKFWDDLLEIRKRHVIGAISLSYHVSPAEKPQEKVTRTTYLGRTITTKTILPSPVEPPIPTRLSQCTYIKIYHETRYTLYVRSVLHAWGTETWVEDTSPSPNPAPDASGNFTTVEPTSRRMKVRPLREKKLVLVDELSQAIGFC